MVFSIIDKENQKAFIARDKHGIKSFLYYKNRIYASENFLDLYKNRCKQIFSLRPGYSLILE